MKIKKLEIAIVSCIVLILVCGSLAMTFFKSKQEEPIKENPTSDEAIRPEPQDELKTYVVVQFRNKIIDYLPIDEDGLFEYQGDYGTIILEIKDEKYHVYEVECPNHTCEQQGWNSAKSMMPISCLPNNIIFYSLEI